MQEEMINELFGTCGVCGLPKSISLHNVEDACADPITVDDNGQIL